MTIFHLIGKALYKDRADCILCPDGKLPALIICIKDTVYHGVAEKFKFLSPRHEVDVNAAEGLPYGQLHAAILPRMLQQTYHSLFRHEQRFGPVILFDLIPFKKRINKDQSLCRIVFFYYYAVSHQYAPYK